MSTEPRPLVAALQKSQFHNDPKFQPMTFDIEPLNDILVCPKSYSKLAFEGDSLICVDPECRLKYEIRDDIPVMLVDEAVELDLEEWGTTMEKHGRNPHTGAKLSKNGSNS